MIRGHWNHGTSKELMNPTQTRFIGAFFLIMIQVILYQYSLSGSSQRNALHNYTTAAVKPKKATNVIVIGSMKATKKHNILQDMPFSYGYVPLRVVRSYVLLELRIYGMQFYFPIICFHAFSFN